MGGRRAGPATRLLLRLSPAGPGLAARRPGSLAAWWLGGPVTRQPGSPAAWRSGLARGTVLRAWGPAG